MGNNTSHYYQKYGMILIIWGIFLVDLVNHAANIYEQEDGRKRSEVLQRLKRALKQNGKILLIEQGVESWKNTNLVLK
jgi:hypothetical protein